MYLWQRIRDVLFHT